MRASDNAKALIKSYEGLRLKAYKCPANVWTIGYGHTKGVTPGMVINRQGAEELFNKDLYDIAEYPISDIFYKAKVTLTQNQFDALCSFVYNVGMGNFKKSTLLRKALANPKDKSIYCEFMKWNKAGGREIAGLTNRRKREADLYFKE